MRANTSTSYGVVDAQRGSGTADISNNATINATGRGHSFSYY